MQIVDRPRDFDPIDSLTPMGQYMRKAFTQDLKASIDVYVNLLSAGIARAPELMRNRVLTAMFPQAPAYDAGGQIAEAVQAYLRTRRFMPAMQSGISRYQLSLRRQARWLFGSHSARSLQAFIDKNLGNGSLIIEGSPDQAPGKSARSSAGVRATHHFVVVKFGGIVYVVDGARGMVFEGLGAYLDAVMLPGFWGQASVRMKCFRVFESGRESRGGITARDDWAASATY